VDPPLRFAIGRIVVRLRLKTRTHTQAEPFAQDMNNLAGSVEGEFTAIHWRVARHQEFTATPLAFQLLAFTWPGQLPAIRNQRMNIAIRVSSIQAVRIETVVNRESLVPGVRL